MYNAYRGFKGWLIVFTVATAFVTLRYGLSFTNKLFTFVPSDTLQASFPAQYRALLNLGFYEVVWFLAIFVSGLILLFLLWMSSRKTKLVGIIFLCVILLGALIDVAWALGIIHSFPIPAKYFQEDQFVIELLYAAIFAIPGILYLLLSKRVRATFES